MNTFELSVLKHAVGLSYDMATMSRKFGDHLTLRFYDNTRREDQYSLEIKLGSLANECWFKYEKRAQAGEVVQLMVGKMQYISHVLTMLDNARPLIEKASIDFDKLTRPFIEAGTAPTPPSVTVKLPYPVPMMTSEEAERVWSKTPSPATAPAPMPYPAPAPAHAPDFQMPHATGGYIQPLETKKPLAEILREIKFDLDEPATAEANRIPSLHPRAISPNPPPSAVIVFDALNPPSECFATTEHKVDVASLDKDGVLMINKNFIEKEPATAGIEITGAVSDVLPFTKPLPVPFIDDEAGDDK